ncbi:MAG TPA: type II toxin-antitoxin system VapC family toxin [Phycicoccus sp.]|nr:type II toxin-antitoxin system VapC family toxin [Phycicoccus sp.]
MTASYLDSSVALRIVLGHSPAAAHWFEQVTRAAEPVLSSRLLRTEMTRALRRLGLPLERREVVLDYVAVVPLDHAVLQEAEAIVPHVKTLDAIHLASALRSGIDDIVICTHDVTMATTARHLGLATVDPVTDDPVRPTRPPAR